MGVYKVIFRDDNLTWDENCPIGMAAVQVARNTQTGECFLQTKLRNISFSQCSAIEFIVRLYSGDGRSEEVEFQLLDADLPAGQVLTPEAKKIELTEVAGADATVTRVDDVRSFGPKVEVPKPKALDLSEGLLEERKILLQNKGIDWAVCTGAHQTHGPWWVCGCGAVNYRRNSCWYCHAPIELLGKVDSPEFLEESACQRAYDVADAKLGSKKREDVAAAVEAFKSLAKKGFKDSAEKLQAANDRLKEVEAANAFARKRARIVIAAVTAAIIAVVAIGATVVIVKSEVDKDNVYNQAQAAESQGAYLDAEALYESLGDYRDSSDRAASIKNMAANEELYVLATSKEEAGTYAMAMQLYESLGDYKDSANRATEMKKLLYQEAVDQFNEGKYSSAAQIFEGLGDYADSARLANEARALSGRR